MSGSPTNRELACRFRFDVFVMLLVPAWFIVKYANREIHSSASVSLLRDHIAGVHLARQGAGSEGQRVP